MINLRVPESFAFDYLSILQVKFQEVGDYASAQNFTGCLFYLSSELSGEVFGEVFDSGEYKNLVAANKEVWDAVALAKEDKVKASEVDRLNYLRWKYKAELQKKFFGGDLTEQKFGYEAYQNKPVEPVEKRP